MIVALGLYTDCVSAHPECGAAHEQRAQVLLELGRWNEAVQAARTACHADSGWGVARLTLGRACLNAGLFTEAVARLKEAVALDASLGDDIADDLKRAQLLQL